MAHHRAFVAARVLPRLLVPGMFFDGVIYATISATWPRGSATFGIRVFPRRIGLIIVTAALAFALESLLFRLLGDHFWVEKLYSTLTGLATAFLIAAICGDWRISVLLVAC